MALLLTTRPPLPLAYVVRLPLQEGPSPQASTVAKSFSSSQPSIALLCSTRLVPSTAPSSFHHAARRHLSTGVWPPRQAPVPVASSTPSRAPPQPDTGHRMDLLHPRHHLPHPPQAPHRHRPPPVILLSGYHFPKHRIDTLVLANPTTEPLGVMSKPSPLAHISN
jgi:hypothetical protein